MSSTSETTFLNTTISVFDAFHPSDLSTSILSLQIDKTNCVYSPPGFSIYCPPVSDNTTLDRQQCFFYIYNADTWPCPATTFQINILSPSQWEWDLDSPEILLVPGNTSWIAI